MILVRICIYDNVVIITKLFFLVCVIGGHCKIYTVEYLEYIYTSTKTQTRFKKAYLIMIYERFRRYLDLPHQVANNGKLL